ncbi:MAG TPA: DegQ family serine endoprotease [Rhodanobacteraceae bacterium]|nr:DegQ family serine endoprotease [Rhodanobacteraceae bacterium]
METRILPRVAAVLVLLCSTAACAANLPDFTGIVEQNAAAVVHVEAHYNGRSAPMHSRGQMPDDQAQILRRFFGLPMMPSPQERKHTSLGSGFIISSDGYVLTNNHVVDHADSVTVLLHDRRSLKAKVVGTDKLYDIALLKIDADDLPTVTLGDSRTLKAGQWVVAIGSPFGLDHTVTQGIVSAVGRSLGARDQEYTPFIQTDVPINRGNSGGPLFDMDGKVVGINSQIFSNTGGYMGVSFSIPIDVAMDAVKQIKDHGYVKRGMIGVRIEDVTPDKARALGLATASGALIHDVTDGGPGDKAGLQVGDVILAFNGQIVARADDLPPMVASTRPGSKVTLKVLHNGDTRNVDVTLGELPRSEGSVANYGGSNSVSSELGFSVADITAEQRKALDLKKDEGVVVTNVTSRAAREAGLAPGDVVLMVGQSKVASVDDFKAKMKQIGPDQSMVMLLVRNNQGNTVFITIPTHADND